jgi:tRNA (guanine-N7-)-methyltransferase
MTTGQRKAFEQSWQRFGIDVDTLSDTMLSHAMLSLTQIFERDAPCTLEIGFGDGEALLAMAQQQPEVNYLGIEVHHPGVGHLLLRLQQLDIDNVRIVCADAVGVLRDHLADACLDRIQIFFPDPWPKKRHHKRRLIQADFVALVARKLKSGGILHLATDWQNYAEQMLQTLQANDDFANTVDDFAARPPQRPQTKFERRGCKLGHPVRDLIFQRC